MGYSGSREGNSEATRRHCGICLRTRWATSAGRANSAREVERSQRLRVRHMFSDFASFRLQMAIVPASNAKRRPSDPKFLVGAQWLFEGDLRMLNEDVSGVCSR